MKKTLLMIVLMLSVVMANAQEEHMKFAGIPLNGTIDRFQSKLIAKGYKSNSYLNKRLPKGTRAFDGTFAGEKADVAVYYNETSKIVYGAKAYFDNLTEEKAKDKLENFKLLLKQKYYDGEFSEGEHNNYPSFEITTYLGAVYGYLNKNADLEGYPYHFSVHLEYYDTKNARKYQNSLMDDL